MMHASGEIRAMTDALNQLDDFTTLGMSELIDADAVRREMVRTRTSDSHFQRGRVLSQVVRREILQQFERARARGEGREVVEWTILYLRSHEGRSLEDIAHILNMPLRSTARYYRRAKQLLLERLYSPDRVGLERGLHCPMCGYPLAPNMPDAAATFRCAACRASIQSQPGIAEGTIQLRVALAHNS